MVRDISIAPVDAQNIEVKTQGDTLYVTEIPTANSRYWYYSKTLGGSYTSTSKRETAYIPEFTEPGSYYVACFSTINAKTFTSNEIWISVITSNDATLYNLTVNVGTLSPTFGATTITYTVTVENSVSSIDVTGTANHANATVTGNVIGKPLNVGNNNVVTITVIAENGITTKTYTVTITRLPLNTSVEDNLKANISAYPTPFRDALHLTGAEGCTLTVFTTTGVVVHTQKIIVPDETIHLERLPIGLYLFRLEKDGKTKTMKIVKSE
jgi:hypothetical protein